MKPPKNYKKSNRLDMPRQKFENLPIYSALNKGSGLYKEAGFEATIKAWKKLKNKTTRLYMSGMYDCARLIWMKLNCEPIEEPFNILHTPDNWRTSHIGEILELYTIHLLELGGMSVSNKQKRLSDFKNQLSGKIDGTVFLFGQEHLLEIKALKHDKIIEIHKKGIKEGAPHYYDQMQLYMYYLIFKSGYMVALDCDTRQYYVEKITIDLLHCAEILDKADEILKSKELRNVPERFVKRDCFYCPGKQLCIGIDGDYFETLYDMYQEKMV